MVGKRNSGVGIISIMVIIRLFITYLPVINNNCPEIIKLFTLVGLYFLLLIYDKQILKNFIFILPIFVIEFFSFTLLYAYPIQKQDLLLSLYAFVRPLSWALAGCFFLQYANRNDAKRLLLWFTLFYVITAITTCIGCSLFPNAARLMATGMEDDKETFGLYMNYNIGGFSFVNTLVILTPLILFALRERVLNKFVSLAILCLVLATILMAEYTTALIFFLSCIVILFTPRGSSIKHVLVVVFIIAITVILLRPLFADLLYYSANQMKSEQIAMRFRELADYFVGVVNSDSTDLEVRGDRWESSWLLFLDNPLFGSGVNGGGHSFVLDTMAQYGVIGLIAELVIFRSIYRKYVCLGKNTNLFIYFVFCFLLQFACACVNPKIFYEPFTLIMPLFYLAFVPLRDN